jgi:hypothetical protein
MWSSSATAIFHVLKREVQTIVVDHAATPRVLHYSPQKGFIVKVKGYPLCNHNDLSIQIGFG